MNGGRTPATPRGRFITFEGIEGSGKSTQLTRLARRLAGGRRVVETREPGGTETGRRLRGVLLEPTDRPMAPETELLLYAADRAQHLIEVVLPALARGDWVLCDRYLDATLAYQGYGRGLGVEAVLALHRDPPLDLRPDRTLLFDLDVERAVDRARRRDADTGAASAEGRFEREALAFHRRVRDGYLALAADDPRRFRRVDADGDEETVGARVAQALADLLPELVEEHR